MRCATDWIRGKQRREPEVHEAVWLQLTTTEHLYVKKIPAGFEKKLIQFQSFVIKKREEKEYYLGQIASADQTPVYSDMPIGYNVNKKGGKEVKVHLAGYEKQLATVMLCCSVDGNKLPPSTVFKRKTLLRASHFRLTILCVQMKKVGWQVTWSLSGQRWLGHDVHGHC